MNNLKIFKNKEFSVNTINENGTIYFVAKDIIKNLGYQNGSRDIERHVDKEDKKKITLFDGYQKRACIVINESGLYSLILGSKMPSAKKFKHWVTSEILPSIRRNGMYATEELLNNPDLFIEVLQSLKKEQERNKRLQLDNSVKTQQIAELEPKVSYYDLVLQSDELMTVTTISKDYGISAKKLNDLLHELKVQYKQSDIWFVYERYASNGYTSTKTQTFCRSNGTIGTKVHTYWTQKGRLFIYDLLKDNGILPLIERC